MIELIALLTELGIFIRMKLPNKQDCRNCKNGYWSSWGDGYHEPIIDEWECPLQYKELQNLTDAFENVMGEVSYDYATICPLYAEMNEKICKIFITANKQISELISSPLINSDFNDLWN